MDRTSLSRNLRPLIRRGLGTMVRVPDRRRRALQTTKRGELSLMRAIPYWTRAQQHVVTTVGSDKWATLGRELRGLAKAIRVGAHHEAIGRQGHTGQKGEAP